MQSELSDTQTRALFYRHGYEAAVREGQRILADSVSIEDARQHFQVWLAISKLPDIKVLSAKRIAD